MTEPALRIGELAHLAGVTTRTVRHYHHIGLLPEPDRRANGYRTYGLAHVVALLRIRRMVDVGLSLDEIGEAIQDENGDDLRELLVERDRDLALQLDRLRDQRAVIAALLQRTDDLRRPVWVQDVMAKLRQAFGSDHPSLERDELVLEYLDSTFDPLSPGLSDYLERLLARPDTGPTLAHLGARFEELARCRPEDPEVEAVAAAGRELMGGLEDDWPVPAAPSDPGTALGFMRALQADLSPAQRRCLTLWFPASPLAKEVR